MVDLRANAIISFKTNGIGSVTAAAGALNRFGSRAGSNIAGGLDRARAATARLSSASLNAAAGISAIIYRTQEFEKKALGVKIASIADATERVGGRILINYDKIAKDGEAIKNQALEISKAYGVSPTGLIAAAEAAAKMGISLEKAGAIMRTSAMMGMADPDMPLGQLSEFLGSLALTYKAPTGDKAYGDWILSTGDKLAMTASATKTSLSRIEEGFRQFSGVFATFGATVDQSAALVGAMTQGGLTDVESGTALKSAALRFIRPTIDGLAALSSAGFDRRNYMDLTGADPRRATQQLKSLFGAYLSSDDKNAVQAMLVEAQKQGKGADPAVIDKVAAFIQKRTGGKETFEDTYLKVLNTITTSGGAVKIFDFLGDVAKAVQENRLTDAQLASIFEGRHLSRMKTLFGQWGEAMRVFGLITGLTGEGLEATRKLRDESPFGRIERSISSIDRAFQRIRESTAFESLSSGFETLSNSIASMPDGQAQSMLALGVGIAALAGSPFALAIAGVTALAKAMGYFNEGNAAKRANGKTVEEMTEAELAAGADSDMAMYAELRKRRIAQGKEQPSAIAKALGWDVTGGIRSPDLLDRIGGSWFGVPGYGPGSVMPNYKPFETVSHFPPDLSAGDGTWQAPPGWIGEDAWGGIPSKGKKRHPLSWAGRSAVPYSDPGHSMVRDIVPTAGPQTIDITGRVQADANVTGSADVTVNNEITVRVEGPGTVVNQTGRGGTASVPLNTGKQAAATKAE